MLFKIKKDNGFTLIEMLIVLSILTILLKMISPHMLFLADQTTKNVNKINTKIVETNNAYDLLMTDNSKSNQEFVLLNNKDYISKENASIVFKEDLSFLFLNQTHIFNRDSVDNYDLTNAYTSDAVNMSFMFSNEKSKAEDLNYFDLSFNQDISSWDTGKVTNMSGMFEYALSFNQDISSWNISNVTDLSYMFHNSKSFDQDLSEWDFSGLDQTTTNSIYYMIQSSAMSEKNIDKLVAAISRDTSFTEIEVLNAIK